MNAEQNFETGHLDNSVQNNFQQNMNDSNANCFQFGVQFPIPVQRENNLGKLSAGTKHVQRNCHVCGDSAIGFNFGGVTCESCKAFFRRVGKLQEEMVCPFKDNCDITVKTRKFCQKCRFDKCIQMGMKVQLLDVRRKTKLRRLKRAQSERLTVSKGGKAANENSAAKKREFTNNQIVIPISTTEHASGTGRILSMHTLDCVVGAMEETELTSAQSTDTGITFQFKMGAEGDWCKLPVVSADKRQDAPSNVVMNTSTQFISFPNTVQMSSPLYAISTWKYCKMQELQMAKEAAQKETTVVHEIRGTCFADFTSADFYHLSQYLVKRQIKQNCYLSGFRNIEKKDQHLLLQDQELIGITMFVRMAAKFNPKLGIHDIGYPGQQYINPDISKLISDDHYIRTQKLTRYFPDKLRSNEMVSLIISAVALFSPNLAGYSNSSSIENERKIYLDILKECLVNEFGHEDGYWGYKCLTCWLNYVRLWYMIAPKQAIIETDPNSLQVTGFRMKKFV